jgi:hypothetical protein
LLFEACRCLLLREPLLKGHGDWAIVAKSIKAAIRKCLAAFIEFDFANVSRQQAERLFKQLDLDLLSDPRLLHPMNHAACHVCTWLHGTKDVLQAWHPLQAIIKADFGRTCCIGTNFAALAEMLKSRARPGNLQPKPPVNPTHADMPEGRALA